MNIEIILVVILLVLLAALFVISYFKKKKFNDELATLRTELKNGDRVMTDSGVVGEVVDSYTEQEYKYFVLKTGRAEHTGYVTVHGNAIYYVFGKDGSTKKEQKVVIKVAPESPKTSVSGTKAEETLMQTATEQSSENKQ